MALTALTIAAGMQIPSVITTATTLTTGTGEGFTITNNTPRERYVELVGSADWYWNQADSVAVANSRKVEASRAYCVQVPPNGQSVTLYCRTASGTSAIIATVER